MEDEAAVTEECADALKSRGILVRICSNERVLAFGDLAILSAEVTDLASFGVLRVAWGLFTPNSRVQMSQCCCAVAVLRNWCDVKMIGCGGNC